MFSEFPPFFTLESSRSTIDAQTDPPPPLAASSGSAAAPSSRARVPLPDCAPGHPPPTPSSAPLRDRPHTSRNLRITLRYSPPLPATHQCFASFYLVSFHDNTRVLGFNNHPTAPGVAGSSLCPRERNTGTPVGSVKRGRDELRPYKRNNK